MRTPEPSKVAANLFHSLPPDDGGRAYVQLNVVDATTGQRKQNYTKILKESLEIENLRGKEESVTLDAEGFQFYSIPSKLKSFANEEEVVKEYLPESIELIKSLTGATRVVLFDHGKLQLREPVENRKSTSRFVPQSSAPTAQNNQMTLLYGSPLLSSTSTNPRNPPSIIYVDNFPRQTSQSCSSTAFKSSTSGGPSTNLHTIGHSLCATTGV